MDGSEGGKDRREVGKRRRQLDRHDPGAEQESRAAAACRRATQVRPEPVAKKPEQPGNEQERDADRELENVPCVQGGVGEPRDDAPADCEEQDEAARSRGGEYAQREQGDLTSRPLPGE